MIGRLFAVTGLCSVVFFFVGYGRLRAMRLSVFSVFSVSRLMLLRGGFPVFLRVSRLGRFP